MRNALLILLAGGALFGAEDSKKETARGELKFWAGISVSRPAFDPDDAEKFMIFFAFVNDSDETITTESLFATSQLLINGKELKNWQLTIGNGPRDHRWEALPAGDNLSFGYALGEHFKEPGIYKVTWKGKEFESREIVFRVLAKKK